MKHSSKIAALAAASLFAAGFCSQASATVNLVVNGGFDLDSSVWAGGYTVYGAGQAIGGGGWTVIGDAGNAGLNTSTTYQEYNSQAGTIVFNAQAGANAYDLTGAGNTGPGDGIVQTIQTVIGQLYELSFYVGNVDGSNYALPSSVSASVGGTSLGTFTNGAVTLGAVNWKQFAQQFVASSNATVLQFNNATPAQDAYAGLDSVSVTAVPEPATWAMTILGFGFIGFGMRGRRRKVGVRFT